MLTLPQPTEEQLRRLDISAPRYTSYPTVPEWTGAVGHEAHAAALERAGRAGSEPLSLYVHVPFCREMCLFCGCNVVIAGGTGAADRYLDDVDREVALAAERLAARREVARLHWGGGTPTSLTDAQTRRLWETVSARFRLAADAEVAIEADPVVTTPERLELLRELGFNRLSMGVQDFDPRVQETVHRVQSYELTAELCQAARQLGFRSVNLDLIYGLPHQTPETWRHTLDLLLTLRPDRIALFSFAYLPELRPHQRKLPAALLPEPSSKLLLFRSAFETFVGAGFQAIGMDHFALPGDELARAQRERRLWRDFQGYTVWRSQDTVAFGITGISDVAGVYAQTLRSRTRYREALAEGRFAIERGVELSRRDRRRREIITALMCNFWVDLGPGAEEELAEELAELAATQREGLVTRSGSQVTVTPLGRLFIRNVAMVFDERLRRRAAADRPVFSRSV